MLRSESLRLLLVWTVILGTATLAVIGQSLRPDDDSPSASGGPGSRVAPIALESELAGKFTIALRSIAAFGALPPEQLLSNAEPLKRDKAPLVDRLAHAVLVGEVEGWQSGIDEARALATTSDAEARLQAGVVALMEEMAASVERKRADVEASAGAPDDAGREGASDVSPDVASDVASDSASTADAATADAAPRLDDAAREEVGAALGYFARLLDPAKRDAALDEAWPLVATLMLVGGWYALAFLAGVAILITLAVLLALGRARPSFAPAEPRAKAIILGEAFAAWLFAFLALTVAGQVALELLPDVPVMGLAVSALAFFSSLGIIPVVTKLRGMPFAEFRTIVGLHAGRGLLRECGHGVACYLSAIPMLLVGLVVFFVLSALWRLVAGEPEAPSHPVVEQLSSSGPLGLAMLFLIASVAAPIVEEIAFRGLLYGHLRGLVEPRRRLLSMTVAALASSFIFAVIHPQGALFVPALGGLAVAFCVYREMRGSLVAPMVAHAIQNAVTLTIAINVIA